MDKIYEKIKNERKRRRITQKELADIVGVSTVSIGNFENGKNVGLKLVEDICDALNLKLDVTN